MAAELTAMEKNMKRRARKRNLVAYSFIAPNFIGFAVFTLGPIVLALLMSFAEWDGSNAMKFVGLQNFVNIFKDDRFLASLKNTIILDGKSKDNKEFKKLFGKKHIKDVSKFSNNKNSKKNYLMNIIIVL